MDANFLSGLLLLAVVLFGAGYVIKTFFWESWSSHLSHERPAAERPPAERKSQEPRSANDHLIGAVGRVVDDGARSGKMRVRVGMETWQARTDSPEAALPIGTQIEVKSISDRTLEVAIRAANGETAHDAEQADKPADPPS